MTVFSSSPRPCARAASIAPPGTATSTASTSETSPPSLPIRVTSWPAFSQRSARPPPTFPLPIVAIFIPRSLRRWYGTTGNGEEGFPSAPNPAPGSTLLAHGTRLPHRPRARRQHADRPPRLGRPRRPATATGQAGERQPRRVGEGPDRSGHDRKSRSRRKTQAWWHHRRAHL